MLGCAAMLSHRRALMDLTSRASAPLVWTWLLLVCLLSLATRASADVIFDFVVSAEFGSPVCPSWQCGAEIPLLPLSGSIAFTDTAVAEGVASPADVVSLELTGGDVEFLLTQLEGAPQWVYFSADRSAISRFESQMFLLGVGFVPIGHWQFRTGDLRSPSLGAQISATELRDGILFRDTLIGPTATATGGWRARAVPEPTLTSLMLFAAAAFGLRRVRTRRRPESCTKNN